MAMSATQKTQVSAIGFTQEQIDELNARNFDWQKFLLSLPALISLVMSFFAAPAPVPPVQK